MRLAGQKSDWFSLIFPSLTATPGAWLQNAIQSFPTREALRPAAHDLKWNVWPNIHQQCMNLYNWSTLNSIQLNSTEWRVIMIIGLFHHPTPTKFTPPEKMSKITLIKSNLTLYNPIQPNPLNWPNSTQSNQIHTYSTISNPLQPNPIHLMQFNANHTTQCNQNRVDH